MFLRSGDGLIGTPEGLKALPVPNEYLAMRASKYLKGAMTPRELLDSPEWIDYALLAESVEGEISNPKQGQSSPQDSQITFQIIPPTDEGEGEQRQ